MCFFRVVNVVLKFLQYLNTVCYYIKCNSNVVLAS